MKILINTLPLQNPHKARGTGVYTKLLIESLQKYEPDHTYAFFTRVDELPVDTEIVHYPFFDPFYLTLPLGKPFPTVVTIHDLIPIAYRQHFPRGIRGEIKWQIQKFSLSTVKRVITDSISSKNDIHAYVGKSLEDIDVIYLAPDERYSKSIPKAMITNIKRKYKLPDDFLLYVGDVNWNKNVLGIIDAFAQIRSKYKNLKLVLVGKSFLQHVTETEQINNSIAKHHLGNDILKTGFIDEEDLGVLYSLANVLVQVSFAEGFGFPVLEAMTYGCRTVVSNKSSLQEISGPSIKVDPGNITNIARGIEEALYLDKMRFKKEAAEWLKKFHWQKVAQETVDSYRKALK